MLRARLVALALFAATLTSAAAQDLNPWPEVECPSWGLCTRVREPHPLFPEVECPSWGLCSPVVEDPYEILFP